MKILILRTFPDELNIKSYNVQEIGLARALTEEGHQCDIALYTKGKERIEEISVQEKKITIYWMNGINILKNLFWNPKILKIIKQYDIIQSCEYDQIYNTYLYNKIGNKLVLYHGPYYAIFNKRYNFKCKIFDTIFLSKKYRNINIISKSQLATAFLKSKGFYNITTVGVGLNNQAFENNNNNNNQQIDMINSKNKHLLYIGKLEERRNILFLIDILKDINKTRKDIDLILIGKGTQKYVDSINEYIKINNLTDKVILIDKLEQSKIKSIYKKSEVFLLPTKYEIFGMVLLEAMYFGIPTITTMNGGSSTIIQNNKNGFIVETKNKELWIKNIFNILGNQKLKENISKNAHDTIKNKFLWNKLTKEFIKVYKGAINNEKIK